MSAWTKQELENMLEDVVNELDLSDGMFEKHGPLGTPPAMLVREVLASKDLEIKALRQGFKFISSEKKDG
jgi:predicted transcriptional regulator